MRRVAAAAALLLVAGCASHYIEICRVLAVDGTAVPPEAQPLDLHAMAQLQGCAHTSIGAPWQFVVVTIESVASPFEFVVRGRYGLEHVRPRLSGATLARLQQLGDHEHEVVARLSASLVGRELIEPSDDDSPVASIDGCRLVRLATFNFELLTDTMNDVLDQLLEELGHDPGAPHPAVTAGGRLDLARVPRDSAALTTFVASTVEAAERHSDFRAPANLVVKRVSFARPPMLSPGVQAAIRQQAGECLGSPNGDISFDTSAAGNSLPGGAIYLNSRLDWRETELRFALLHELVHQHQFAMCERGAVLGVVPASIREAHASSLALAVLEATGADDEMLDFVTSWDSNAAGVRAFDALREDLRLSPDECLVHLAGDAAQAAWLANRIEFGQRCCRPPDSAADRGPLSFEIVGPPSGRPVVAIVNDSDEPFAGSFNGAWHYTTSTSKTYFGGGTPAFSLRLPPRGRLLLRTQLGVLVDGAVESCHAAYRMTPSPVFDLGEPQPSVADDSSG